MAAHTDSERYEYSQLSVNQDLKTNMIKYCFNLDEKRMYFTLLTPGMDFVQ